MSIQSFMHNTCTITEENRTTSWWESIITDNVLYSNIKCSFFFQRLVEEPTQSTRNSTRWRVSVIVEPDKTNIKDWQKVVIHDTNMWDIINWVVENTKIYRHVNTGINQHIQFNIKETA